MAVTKYGIHDELINRYSSTLNGSISSSDTTITVSDATGLPTAGFFTLQIGSELIRCSGRSGAVLAVDQRGDEGTAAAAHSSGVVVQCVLTEDTLRQYLLRGAGHGRSCGYTGDASFADSQAWPIPMRRPADESRAALTVSDFTWRNQGSATATDSNGAIVLTVPDEANFNLRGLELTAPSTPYAMTARLRMALGPGVPASNTSSIGGLWAVESSTGKLLALWARYGDVIEFGRWSSVTTYSADIGTRLGYHEPNWLWFRFVDNGTDVKGFFSTDGSNWTYDDSAWWQESRTAFLSGGANRIGFFLNSGSNSGSYGSGPAVCTMVIDAFNVEQL